MWMSAPSNVAKPATIVALRSALARVALNEDVNFLVTNRIPRQLVTQFMGWFGKRENPVVRDLSLLVWRLFTEVNLDEAAKQQFASLHDCFIRELKAGARPIDADPSTLVSPCDAIVGACGAIEGTRVYQAKGFPYTLEDLLHDPELIRLYRDGSYVTLRLSSSMYHRFHAPHDCRVEQVTYISGDTWNTNPITVNRVEKLFCKNERAILRTRLGGGQLVTLVPVASILVASIRLHFLDVLLHLRYRGPNVIPCDAAFDKGQEMGWFELGSTIIVFAPAGFRLADQLQPGATIKMGQPLLRLP
jgi:phosphatidylserine decarboxylase